MDEFVEKVQQLRGFPSKDNMLYKIFIDEGQNKLMVSLSIIEWMNPESLEQKGRFKSSGVNRVFVLACAPCKETYENVKVLLEKIDLHNFSQDWKLCCDLKFANIFCGLGQHKSAHPCFVCTWKRGSKEPGLQHRTFAGIRSMSTKGGQPKEFFRSFSPSIFSFSHWMDTRK